MAAYEEQSATVLSTLPREDLLSRRVIAAASFLDSLQSALELVPYTQEALPTIEAFLAQGIEGQDSDPYIQFLVSLAWTIVDQARRSPSDKGIRIEEVALAYAQDMLPNATPDEYVAFACAHLGALRLPTSPALVQMIDFLSRFKQSEDALEMAEILDLRSDKKRIVQQQLRDLCKEYIAWRREHPEYRIRGNIWSYLLDMFAKIM